MEDIPSDSMQSEPKHSYFFPCNSSSLESGNNIMRSEVRTQNDEHGKVSPQAASRTLWSTGTLTGQIQNGFYSVIPDKILKEHFLTVPTPDELSSLGRAALKAEIIIVDAEKDKKLSMLKQLTAALVKGLNSNPASLVKKIAGLVIDFYKRPDPELNPAKSSIEEISPNSIENRGRLLGQIKNGSCRPRAILFKVLADSVGLDTKLIEGIPSDGVLEYMESYKHLSVVVVLNSVELLVDLMRFPGQLIPLSDRAISMSHITVADDESVEYDSCDSPLEPNSPVFGYTDRKSGKWYTCLLGHFSLIIELFIDDEYILQSHYFQFIANIKWE